MKKQLKKLTLNKETLRDLNAHNAGEIKAGGRVKKCQQVNYTLCCPRTVGFNSNCCSSLFWTTHGRRPITDELELGLCCVSHFCLRLCHWLLGRSKYPLAPIRLYPCAPAGKETRKTLKQSTRENRHYG